MASYGCSPSWSRYVSSSELGRNNGIGVLAGHIWSSTSAVWARFWLVGCSLAAGHFLQNSMEAGTVMMSARSLSKAHDLQYFSRQAWACTTAVLGGLCAL